MPRYLKTHSLVYEINEQFKEYNPVMFYDCEEICIAITKHILISIYLPPVNHIGETFNIMVSNGEETGSYIDFAYLTGENYNVNKACEHYFGVGDSFIDICFDEPPYNTMEIYQIVNHIKKCVLCK